MIIGLSGYARSGKDEVAKILVEEFGFVRVAFADKIRELLYKMDPPVEVGVSSEKHIVGLQNYVDIYGWDTAKQHPMVRAMLQNLGVGARKTFGDGFWVWQVIQDLEPNIKYVITDVRFENEADFVKESNGKIWRVVRAGVEPVNSHISERDMDGYKVDMILKNEGTLEDLRTLVRSRMETLNAN